MIRILLALLMLAASIPVSAQTVLSRDADTRWVPFELTAANHIRFAMTIDGVTANALLDTGLSHSAVSRDFVRRAKLTVGDNGRVQAVALGGEVPVEWAATRTIRLGALNRTGGQLAVIDLPALLASTSAGTDALIGADLLAGHALDIDFAARRFRIIASGAMPFAGVHIPLRIQPGSGVFLSDAVLGSRIVRPLLVDTGDGTALTVTRDEWRRARVQTAGVTSTIAFGVGGEVRAGLAVTDKVRLGTASPGQIEVRIEEATGFARQTRTAGRIGTGLLQRYRVLIDPRAGRMVIAPNAELPAPPLKSTTGLLLGYDRARLRVLHVMANSPAATAKWAAGDLICSVDGVAVALSATGGIDARWTAATAGRTVRLSMCDGTERTLTAANFY